MSKLNYSTATWLAEMIITESGELEKSLQEIEKQRKFILKWAQRLLNLLEEARPKKVSNDNVA